MIYRNEIDGLRALAVCAVLANHFFHTNFPNGYLGVDIFFVISGFVITGSLCNRGRSGLCQFLLEFYVRRIRRLIPALAACIVVTSVLISVVHPHPQQFLKTGLFALFGLSNIYLYYQSTDYFGDAASLNPFTHTWSLGVEEQFYLIFPLLFWLSLSILKRPVILWAGSAFILASLSAWWVVSAEDPLLAFYVVFFRFWQIGLGVLAFVVQDRVKWLSVSSHTAKALLCLGLLVLTFAPITVDARIGTVLAALSTALLLLWIGPDKVTLATLQQRLPTYIGRVSYSLYLWHWPVAVLLKYSIGLTWLTGAIGVLASLGLAHLSYRMIEVPFRQARIDRHTWQELSLGVGGMGVTAAFLVFFALELRPHILLASPAPLEAAGVGSLTRPYISESGTVWDGTGCVLSDNNEVGKVISPEQCNIGQPLDEAQILVLVVGNSFSAAFAEAFDGLSDHSGYNSAFILTSSWGAKVVPEIPNTGPWSEANADYWARVIPDLIGQLDPLDHVLLVSDLANFSPAEPTNESLVRLATLETGLRRLSEDLSEKGIGLSMLAPLPFARDADCHPNMAISQWYQRGSPLCQFYSREDTLVRLAPLRETLARLEMEGSIRLLDLFPLFCGSETCTYTTTEGIMLYRDIYSHPSVEASRLARPYVGEWLDDLTTEGTSLN